MQVPSQFIPGHSTKQVSEINPCLKLMLISNRKKVADIRKMMLARKCQITTGKGPNTLQVQGRGNWKGVHKGGYLSRLDGLG